VRIAHTIYAMRTDDGGVAGGGPALFILVRFWSRRWAGGGVSDAQVGHVLVLEAIAATRHEGVAYIGAVATELGLDRSNASRMLASAVAAGLVTKAVSPQDARRTELALTATGEEMLGAAHAWQQQTFERMTAGWSASDTRRLSSYLVRLASQRDLEGQP
jgi:DNA-binding MarR family transcriptional regulator